MPASSSCRPTPRAVWVNGHEVGRAANMLIGHRFAVTAALRPGRNRITVRLGSALNHARGFSYDAASSGADFREEGLFLRKAPHVWGWDILPRAVSASPRASGGPSISRHVRRPPSNSSISGRSRRISAARPSARAGSSGQTLQTWTASLRVRVAGGVPGRRLPHPRARCAALVAARVWRSEPVHGDHAALSRGRGAG